MDSQRPRTEPPSDALPAGERPRAGEFGIGPAAAGSPGLASRRRGDGRAFEMKFLVDEAGAQAIERAVRGALGATFAIDPFADLTRGGYSISSLYCDTPDRAVLRRVGPHRWRKYRVRQYGDGTVVYLERKSRRGMAVSKHRVAIDAEELGWLDGVDGGAAARWPGASFREQLVRRGLAPACVVHYDRSAFLGALEGKPVRVTFDRRVRGSLAHGWSLAPTVAARPAIDGVVCELKFHAGLPVALKQIIAAFGLAPRGVSKYRHCMAAWGFAPTPGTEGEVRDA